LRLVLHIGAHRTGSTLVEQMLSSASDDGAGLAVWSPRHMRALPGFSRVHAHVDTRGEPLSANSAKVLGTVRAQVTDAMATLDADALLISEENMLGTMGTNFRTGRFYPSVGARLSAFAAVLPAPVRVGLGIRGYAQVWNSAYGYVARRGKPLPGRAQARDALLARPRGWTAVVDAVRRVWPETEIMVWRQEDLGDHAGSIAEALMDLDPGAMSASLGRVNSSTEKGQVVDLFSDADHDALAARYTRHVRRLMQDGAGVRWAHLPEAA